MLNYERRAAAGGDIAPVFTFGVGGGGRASADVTGRRGPATGFRSEESTDGGRFAEMFAFHGKPAAAIADELHGGQLALAHVGLADLRRTTK